MYKIKTKNWNENIWWKYTRRCTIKIEFTRIVLKFIWSESTRWDLSHTVIGFELAWETRPRNTHPQIGIALAVKIRCVIVKYRRTLCSRFAPQFNPIMSPYVDETWNCDFDNCMLSSMKVLRSSLIYLVQFWAILSLQRFRWDRTHLGNLYFIVYDLAVPALIVKFLSFLQYFVYQTFLHC